MENEQSVTDNTVAESNYITEDAETIKASVADNEATPIEAPETEEKVDVEAEKPSEKPKRKGRLERELDRKNAEIARLSALIQPQNQEKQSNKSDFPIQDGPPRIEDYEDVMDYYDARQDWKVKEALREVQKQQSEAQKQVEINERIDDFNEREAAIIEENPDYTEKLIELHEDGALTPKMISYIREESPIGEKIALHLTKFPADAAIIAQLDGKQFEKAMWAIEHYVSTNQGEVAVVKTTKAPQPISPVKSNAVSSKDPGEMDYDEYRIKRLERLKAQGLI